MAGGVRWNGSRWCNVERWQVVLGGTEAGGVRWNDGRLWIYFMETIIGRKDTFESVIRFFELGANFLQIIA